MFIYSSFCVRQFDQKLWSSLIYFFYLHTTIQSKYMVLFHLFFLLQTTFRPEYMVLFHLLFLLCTTIRVKIRGLINLFRLFAHDYTTKINGSLQFIFSLVDKSSTKNWGTHCLVLFDIFLLCAWLLDQILGSSLVYFFYLFTITL